MSLRNRVSALEQAAPYGDTFDYARADMFYDPALDPDGTLAAAIKRAKARGGLKLPTFLSWEEFEKGVDYFV